MINIVLFQPEIPQNTGNIIRLCANTKSKLHLIKPLGFELDDKKMRRSGLDYHEFADIKCYESWQDFLKMKKNINIYAFTTKTQKSYCDINFVDGVFLLFGPETRGLPETIRSNGNITAVTIPMAAQSRSINLANAVAIAMYEVLRQQKFVF